VVRQPASGTSSDGRRPFLVAHRAGNRLADLKAAEQLGAAQIEADVRLHRRKLEVRHLKTIGPLPILWDRWELAAPWHPRLQLHELFSATAPETELLLDLKGQRRELGKRVLDAIRPHLGKRDLTVCARNWRVLEPFAGYPVRCVHSVGSARQLRRLQSRFAGERLDGISIHERLLDRDSVVSLRAIADVIMTWPVNVPERARELLRLGVDGLITDDVAGLASAGVLEATT
jgi:glycerophosphoryl diester phosphodiesterase